MQRQHWTWSVMLLAAGALAMVLLACNKDTSNPTATNDPAYTTGGGTPAPPPANTVFMASMAFSPTSITVPVGTTVTWQNNDAVAHTATSDSGKWDTGNIATGGTGKITFNTAGTYPYNCIYHASMGMRGTVIVQ